MLVLLVLIEENVKGTTSECSLACDIFLLEYYTTTRHRQYYFARDLFSTYFDAYILYQYYRKVILPEKSI